VDGEGRSVYVFTQDTPGESACTADCVSTWPIVSTDGDPTVDGLDEELVGVLEREDGTEQITYNDKPLYYFVGDSAVGDIAGHGVNDEWFVISPEGDSIAG
jgi:predicted lipoprotein with Yx(FWY)xxD motif